MKDLTRNSQTIFSPGWGQLWGNPLDLHGNRDGQHPLAMFVPELNRELTGTTLRQSVPADLGHSGRFLLFGII